MNVVVRRSLPGVLILLPFLLTAQLPAPQPPAWHGGNPARVLNLRDPAAAAWRQAPEFDYTKQYPRYRTLVPLERKCTTPEMEQDLRTRYADAREDADQFENWMDQSILRMEQTRSISRKAGAEIVTLPVVVHVIYSQPVENISDEQIFSQLRVLNEDYRRTNLDRDRTDRNFKTIAADMEIEFCLASVDPLGNPTQGIDRVSLSGSPFSEKYINEVIKPRTIWDPTRYLNLWVCSISNGILGFAQFPMSSMLVGLPQDGTAQTDGVVINYLAFGTTGTVSVPFNKGRTATHEIGHWLGLRHIWGDGGCEADDYCEDTPNTDQPHFACPPGSVGCNGGPAMAQNYMDYTDDRCMNLFTLDQKKRMLAVLRNSPRRRELVNSDACQAPVIPPSPDFVADVTAGCGPLTVSFTDRTEGEPDTWAWSFPGGKPEISALPNPRVVYRKGGTYPVTLTATNAAGSKTITRTGYIQVTEFGTALPLAEAFESGETLPAGFMLINPDGDAAWKVSQIASGEGRGTGSLFFPNYDNQLRGAADWFMSPLLDFSQVSKPFLAFKVAYAPFDEKYSDTLGVYIATACGTEFRSIYHKGGRRLATADPYSRAYIPLDDEWRTEVIDLSEYAGQPFVQVAFVNFSGNGNDVYIDDISLGNLPPPLPEARFEVSAREICAGESVTFQDRSTRALRRVWTFPGASQAGDTTTSPAVTYDQPGVYAVSLTVTNATGAATAHEPALITVRPRPALLLSASAPEVCLGEEVTLTAVGAGPLTWYADDALLEQTGNRIVMKPEATAVYRVTGGESGCIASASVAVSVRNTRPMTILPPVSAICAGESVQLQALGAGQYTWSPATGLNATTGSLVTASPAQTTTYTVTGTGEGGCILRQQVTVSVGRGPADASLTATPMTVCPGQPVSLRATGGASYRWVQGEGLNVQEGAEAVAYPVTSGLYTAEIAGTDGCRVQRTVNVRVSPRPTVRLLTETPSVCPGERLVLRAEGADTYVWSQLSSVSGARAELTPEASTTYEVIGITTQGCRDTASIYITVKKSNPIAATPPAPSVCPGSSIELQASGGSGYVWTGSSGYQTRGEILALRPARTENWTLTGLDSAGCRQTTQVVVQVSAAAPLTAAFSADKPVSCVGTDIQFRSEAQDAQTWAWEFPGAVVSRSASAAPVVRYPGEGIYDVALTVTGCDRRPVRFEQRGYVVIAAPARITLNTGDRTVCKGEAVRLEASGAAAYTWTPATGLDRTSGHTVLAKPEGTVTYTVTGEDEGGCKASKQVTISTIGSESLIRVSPAAPSICAGSSVTLSAEGGVSYRWSPTTGLDKPFESRITASPAVSTVYTLEATNNDGCTSRLLVPVTVRQPPRLALSPAAPSICAGESVTLRTGAPGTYTWSPAYGLSSQNGAEVTAVPRESTTYTVSGTDASGCPVSGSVTVSVSPVSSASLTLSASSDEICRGDTVWLTAGGADTYQWLPAEGLIRSFGNGAKIAPARTTVYTVASGAGCAARQQVTVRVLEPQPLTVTPANSNICLGDEVSLVVSGGKGYIWDAAEGIQTVAGATALVKPRQTTAYYVSGVDAQGCEARGVATVEVSQPGFLRVAASSANICEGEEVLLHGQGAVSYQWAGGSNLRSVTGDRTSARPRSTEVYRVTGRDEAGCTDTASLRIAVQSLEAVFESSADTLDLATGTGELTVTDLTPGATVRRWDFGGAGGSDAAQATHIFARPGTYVVTLTSGNGVCEAVARQTVYVLNSSDLRDLTLAEALPPDSLGLTALHLESPRPMLLQMRLLDDSGTEWLSGPIRLDGTYQQRLDLRAYPPDARHLQITDGREVRAFVVR